MKFKFGDKLRSIRERKRMTMRDVASRVGVSESMISQIETNKVSPAIDTLLSISEVLEIDFEYLFKDLNKSKVVNIVRKYKRNKIELQGVFYEQLVKTVDENSEYGIEAYYMTIDVGNKSGSDQYGHKGRELGVIISGVGEFLIGQDSYILEEGDSISFESSVPHMLINKGKSELKAFWIITPPKQNLGHS